MRTERFTVPHALLRSWMGGDAVIVFSLPSFASALLFTVAEQAPDLSQPLSGSRKAQPSKNLLRALWRFT